MSTSQAILFPILLYIQANLDADLSLKALAVRSECSPYYFHRIFHDQIGETPKRYVQRLRLEQAFIRLWLYNTTVLDVALAVGFQNHETFTRAFQRHFKILPKYIKKQGASILSSRKANKVNSTSNHSFESYELSATRVVKLEPMHIACIRQTGPYEDVPESLWKRLQLWAKKEGLGGYQPLLGIGYDAPGVTPSDKLRFDAAIRVEKPFPVERLITYRMIDAGWCAMTTHVGSYFTLANAYRVLLERISTIPGIHFAGPPAIEIYHENHINMNFSINHTDICLPIIRESSSLLSLKKGSKTSGKAKM